MIELKAFSKSQKMLPTYVLLFKAFNPLNAELNPTCHLLALLGSHHILHVSRIRVNISSVNLKMASSIMVPFLLHLLVQAI